MILIVDDEPLNLIALKHMLNKLFKNVTIIEAIDGVTGFELFNKYNNKPNNSLISDIITSNNNENTISLILTDLNMPNLDGYKMTSMIKNFIK